MPKAIDRMLANNLADFEGLKVEGTIVVNEALLNAFISDYLSNLGTESEPNTAPPTPQAPSAMNMKQLLQSLCIDRAEVHLQDGKMHINFKVTK